ncbi:basic phospholipase A2 Sms-N6-like [Eublepharis macularius]|uniref:Phospholipase A2 n=1 Tax=Eublepharis macularius TaxID=481883 RepID=A0AA97KL59_EUBMA|nr:basic phospholipase A2 Sms-N6-like [Eublepharis macularius]
MEKNLPALVALLFAFGVVITDGNLFQLQKMIKEATGKQAIPNYSSYGCHCGLGGKGKPLDDTDWCCHYHDCCYEKMENQGCKPKTVSYSYSYLSGNMNCGGGTSCEQQVCECDRNLAMCLKKHLGSYSWKLRFYWNIFCSNSAPEC